MSNRTYGPEEKAKLQRTIEEGITTMQEVEDLKEGLKDTVKSVAEELDVKPALINKAIKTARNNDLDRHKDELEDLEIILHAAGKNSSKDQEDQ